MLQILCSSLCRIVTIGVGRPGVIRGPELSEGHPIPQLGPAAAPGQRVGQGVGAWAEKCRQLLVKKSEHQLFINKEAFIKNSIIMELRIFHNRSENPYLKLKNTFIKVNPKFKIVFWKLTI